MLGVIWDRRRGDRDGGQRGRDGGHRRRKVTEAAAAADGAPQEVHRLPGRRRRTGDAVTCSVGFQHTWEARRRPFDGLSPTSARRAPSHSAPLGQGRHRRSEVQIRRRLALLRWKTAL